MTDDGTDRYEARRVAAGAPLSDAHEVRRAVFIDEQGVSEAEEMDGKDGDADHWVIYDCETDTPVATARMRTPTSAVAKAERVAVYREYRNEGLGSWLMELLAERARELGCSKIRLHAQTAVREFYGTLGYEVVSDEFMEANIPHVEMEKRL